MAVLDPAADGQTAPAHARRAPDDFAITWVKGQGAGGQHRNKHACSARIRHIPTGLVRSAQTRSRENSRRLAMESLTADLDAMAASASGRAANSLRRDQIGSGERGDKRRTYRWQDGAVQDHVTGKRADVEAVMSGRPDLLWA